MIILKNIKKTYRTDGDVVVNAIKDVSLTINEGEFVAIMGASGSGKSTLLHILGFLDRPDEGSYTIFGREVSSFKDDELAVLRNSIAGFVFQQFHLLSRVSALGNAELPLIYAGKRHLRKRALERLANVGLAQRKHHHPNQLSGGEQQRVAIARSLVNDPIIIFADEPTGNLDTKSEEEIIVILKELNRQGKTIIMVTHEKEVAEHAERIIVMRDGVIISDETKKQKKVPSSSSIEDRKLIDEVLSGKHFSRAGVSLREHLRYAVISLISHKMRSFLSMLGVLIGVGAVIAMLALGEGAKEAIKMRLASLGSNLLTVRPGAHAIGGVALEAGTVTRFTIQDAEAIEKIPQVRATSPSVHGNAQVVYQNRNLNTRVEGQGTKYETIRAATPIMGKFFTEEDVKMRKKVALLGITVANSLFPDKNPVGETIKINRINFKVIGILPEKGSSAFRDQDDIIIIPVTTAMYRLLGENYIDSIDVQVKDASLIDETQEALKRLMLKRLRFVKNPDSALQIRNMSEIQETLTSTTRTMSWLLGAIAAISLVVGGIGIMNIMLVSVTERTREIGLRKAIGARGKDILLQFLIESIVITFTGGLLGIAMGVGSAVMLSLFAGWTTKVSVSSVVMACAFSIAVGTGFGLWPARQAALLNPIEALRYE